VHGSLDTREVSAGFPIDETPARAGRALSPPFAVEATFFG
jgi:hypothetical protein